MNGCHSGTAERVSEALNELLGGPHQVVLVDDGSSDDSLALLQEAALADDRLVVVSFSRNFGQQPAYAATDMPMGRRGLNGWRSSDPPEQIKEQLEKFNDGYDVVYAIRVNHEENVINDCYNVFYRMINVYPNSFPRDGGDFSMVNQVAQLLQPTLTATNPRGIRSWVGFQQVGLEIERDEQCWSDKVAKQNYLTRL